MNKEKVNKLDYESPQLIVMEIQPGHSLLQASKDDYIDGGDDTWGITV